ncbi:von Willebrand factor A domain-containing protein 5A-like [Simochromis diagramma]|uniref:von Willebrand factor A domain-containing protein 5A-like n=1 Tax=Simochromis diagramma TaxID=43689 RepID=UPI001A7E6A13|nr:von Willebrand factor A domain-containing protein 5A-like [Simochromis diagramma]
MSHQLFHYKDDVINVFDVELLSATQRPFAAVSLQEASGCWLLDPALAAALGQTNEEVEKSKPEKTSSEVWATILALIWLHGFKMDAKDEWELLAMKAASWLCAHNAPCVSECVMLEMSCWVQREERSSGTLRVFLK